MSSSDDNNNSNNNKRLILERRKRFIAAAVAGVGLAACGKTTAMDEGTPTPCLSVAIDYDAGPPPTPCLTPVSDPPFPDASAGPPRPCLEPPRPCLGARANPKGCDQPFTIDSRGVKVPKPECF